MHLYIKQSGSKTRRETALLLQHRDCHFLLVLMPAKRLKSVCLLHPIRGCLKSVERFLSNFNSTESHGSEGDTWKLWNKKCASRQCSYLGPNNDEDIQWILTMPLWKKPNKKQQLSQIFNFFFFLQHHMFHFYTDFIIKIQELPREKALIYLSYLVENNWTPSSDVLLS